MNYFAHAWVASRMRPHPRCVLGAMLPDLASLLGVRLPPQPDPEVAAGIALHHATDAVFHGSPGFLEHNRRGVRDLAGRGLSRGPARASAHVGIELLLDAALAAPGAAATAAYRSALAASADVRLRWPSDRAARRFPELVQRLAGLDPSDGLGAPVRVAERIRRTLERRPRLALAASDPPRVAAWLAQVEAPLADDASALAGQTLEAVRTRSTRPGDV